MNLKESKQNDNMSLDEHYKVVRTVKVSPKKPVENISRGSWRFSMETSSEPFVPVVTVKDDLKTRSMVLSKTYEHNQGGENIVVKKEGSKRHNVKDEIQSITKKQKLDKDSTPLAPESKKVNYSCKDCRKKCISLREVKSHLCVPKIQCEDCKPVENNFQNRKLLLLHLSHSHPTVGNIIACKFCEKGASNKTFLREHIKKYHPNEFAGIYEDEQTSKDHQENEIVEETIDKELDQSNESIQPSQDDIELISLNEVVENSREDIMPNENDPEIENIDSDESNKSNKKEIDSRKEVKQNKSVSFLDTFEEDIDAPDSVVSSSQVEDGMPRSLPQLFPFNCVKCKKGFQTARKTSKPY